MIILKVAKKTGFHPLFRRYAFRKTTGGVQIDHPPRSRFRVKVIFWSPSKLNALFRYNGVLEKRVYTDIAYKGTCSSPKVNYYGKRSELMRVSNLIEKPLKVTNNNQQ